MPSQVIHTPIGALQIIAQGGFLTNIHWEGTHTIPQETPRQEPTQPKQNPAQDQETTFDDCEALLATAAQQILEYFAGQRRAFTLPLNPGGTPFQKRVWQALQEIPYGHVISYKQLAQRIGQPTALRAVGGANHRNPLPIVIPCHRVIASDGSLGGFGGGLEIKRALLELESGSLFARQFQP